MLAFTVWPEYLSSSQITCKLVLKAKNTIHIVIYDGRFYIKERRTTKDSSSRRIMHLVPVLILELHN